jgi:hypothetical protein
MTYGPLITVLVLALLLLPGMQLLRRMVDFTRFVAPQRRDVRELPPTLRQPFSSIAAQSAVPLQRTATPGPGARGARTRLIERFAPLEANALIATALDRRRAEDFSERAFVTPLQELLHALHAQAELSTFGQLATRFDALRCLDNQLALASAERVDASITRRDLVRPIFITGLPRCGSTFLHSLIALDPAVAVPHSWQVMYPYPLPGLRSRIETRRARVARQFAFFRLLSPQLSGMHPLAADAPQECTDITAQVFQSLRFDTIYRIPMYRDWLDEYGHEYAYRFHRRFLQHLDAQHPGAQRWVLKSPDHVFALAALRKVYPDAHIVMLHRDPLSVLASVAKLTEILRRPFTRHLDPVQIGAEISARWAEGAERMVATRAADTNILHLHYSDLVSAPMDTIATLYRHCGMPLSAAAEMRMRAALRARPRGGYAVHAHRLESFGLDAGQLRERFARYMQTFDVRPAERARADTAQVMTDSA